MAIAGRVAIVPKGEYSNTTSYEHLDLVTYGGNAYVVKKDCMGVEPTNTEYYMLVMENVVAEDLTTLEEEINAILSGTKQVANAATLDGYAASYFVSVAQMADVEESLEEIKTTTTNIYDYLTATDAVYGFIEHMNVLSPSTRITPIGYNKNFSNVVRNTDGSLILNEWADFGVVKGNKPYMVKSDGTPDYMLDETDYTKQSDGTTTSDIFNTDYDGGAFSWIPRVYKHEHMEGDDRVVMFSMVERDGFEPNGFKDPDNNVLEGAWFPMFFGSIVNDKMMSLAGLQPDYSKTTGQQYTAINNFSPRAKFLGGSLVETLIDILIMMAGTTNLQEVYGYGNSSGYDSTAEPTYGVKPNEVISGGQFYCTADGKSLNKVFHSIVLTSYNQWMRDPYELVVNGRVKVSKNYTYDLTGTTYEDTGINIPDAETTSWYYPLRYQTVEGYGSVPAIKLSGGSTSTGSCDGLYRRSDQSSLVAVSLRFGNCYYGSIAGCRARNWNNVASNANWNIGSA